MSNKMSDKYDDKSRKEISPFPIFDPAEFSMFGNQNLQVMTRAARAYYNGAAKLNQELMGFVNERVRKDIETATSFMSSKTTEEAFHHQAEFVEEAIRDYADEASKILHLAADLAHETLAPVEERTEEVLHEFDERAEQAEQKAAAE
ncbi:MAG: phasin family protein [Marinicaulis sp.]|nr:phasin family protein [Marinicaulis sp.]